MTEQVPVYIKEISVTDFKGFRGKHKFSFVDEGGNWCRWNIFLGNNNTGKTNLLKAIASLESKSDNEGNNKTYYPLGLRKKIFSNDSKFGNLSVCILSNSITKKDIRVRYSHNSFYGPADWVIPDLLVYGYGVLREIEKKGLSAGKDELLNSENLFYNTKLIDFEEWLFQLYLGQNNQSANKEIRSKFQRTVGLLIRVLTSEIFPEIDNIRFTSDRTLNNYIEFKTKDGWRRMSELGYGYQATLSWMADFCKKMFDRYPDSPNPLKEPAVLLIDEIDLHLHPQWQRGLIKSLSDIFPQTQFIVTTHSPFIIQSMENVNLYTLNRVGDHTEVKHLGNKSYIGWKIEEILSEVMGLDEKIHTDRYNELMAQFDEALDTDDYAKGKEAYDQLMLILHPQSAERKLLDIQFTQLSPTE